MKNLKSFSEKLGISLAIIGFFGISKFESKAQSYDYKILIGVTITPLPGGDIIKPWCIHGPGLCRGTSEQ